MTTIVKFWNYYRDEWKDYGNENNVANNYRTNNKTTANRSFGYKIKIIRSTPDDNNTLDKEVVLPLKYLSNF